VLEDAASYAAGYTRSQILADTWAWIGELLRQPGGFAAASAPVRTAVDQVDQYEAGSSGWWLAVWAAARACDEYFAAAARARPARPRPIAEAAGPAGQRESFGKPPALSSFGG
jgi:hypothetical protein